MNPWGAVLRRGGGGEKGTGVDYGLGGGETSLLSPRPVAPIIAARLVLLGWLWPGRFVRLIVRLADRTTSLRSSVLPPERAPCAANSYITTVTRPPRRPSKASRTSSYASITRAEAIVPPRGSNDGGRLVDGGAFRGSYFSSFNCLYTSIHSLVNFRSSARGN